MWCKVRGKRGLGLGAGALLRAHQWWWLTWPWVCPSPLFHLAVGLDLMAFYKVALKWALKNIFLIWSFCTVNIPKPHQLWMTVGIPLYLKLNIQSSVGLCAGRNSDHTLTFPTSFNGAQSSGCSSYALAGSSKAGFPLLSLCSRLFLMFHLGHHFQQHHSWLVLNLMTLSAGLPCHSHSRPPVNAALTS